MDRHKKHKHRSDKGKPRKGLVSIETRQKQSGAKKQLWMIRQPKKHHLCIP